MSIILRSTDRATTPDHMIQGEDKSFQKTLSGATLSGKAVRVEVYDLDPYAKAGSFYATITGSNTVEYTVASEDVLTEDPQYTMRKVLGVRLFVEHGDGTETVYPGNGYQILLAGGAARKDDISFLEGIRGEVVDAKSDAVAASELAVDAKNTAIIAETDILTMTLEGRVVNTYSALPSAGSVAANTRYLVLEDESEDRKRTIYQSDGASAWTLVSDGIGTALHYNVGVASGLGLVFASISDLGSSPGSSGEHRFVSDQKRGGLFEWASSGSADSGTVFSDGSTGYWKRVYSGGLDARWFGATGDGSTNDRAAIAAADAVEGTNFLPVGIYKLETNITIASDTQFASGAILKPASGVVVTISGNILSGGNQIFDTSLGGSFVLGSLAAARVNPKWFGALGDDSTDDRAAIQSAIDSMTSGGVLSFPLGIYRISKVTGTNDVWGIKVTNSNITLASEIGGAVLRRHSTNIALIANAHPLLFIGTPDSDVASATENVTVSGIHFYGEDTRHSSSGQAVHDHRCAVEMRNTKNVTFIECFFTRVDSQAIYTIRPANYDQVNATYYNLTKNYNLKVIGCTFEAEPHATAGRALIHGIVESGVDGLLIDGNTFDWVDNGNAGETTYDTLDQVETDTYAPGYGGWSLGNVKRSGRGQVISNNIYTNCSEHPIYSGSMDVVISGNRVRADDSSICNQEAIKLRAKSVSITGNVITGHKKGIGINVPSYDVSIAGNTMECPGDFSGGAIMMDTVGLTSYIDARAWLSTYSPMSGVSIVGNTLTTQEAAQTTNGGNAIRFYTDIADANFPDKQIVGVMIASNTFKNFRAGIYIVESEIRQINVVGNSFIGKPFTESGFSTGTAQESEAVVKVDFGKTAALVEMAFNNNYAYGFEYLFKTYGGTGTLVHLARSCQGNRLDYIKYLASTDFRSPDLFMTFSGNTGSKFLDGNSQLYASGYGIENALGDTDNQKKKYKFHVASGVLRFYNDDAGSYHRLNTETGTWTPAFTPASGSFGAITYGFANGFWARNGKIVHVWGNMRTTALTVGGASGVLTITGLPFAVDASLNEGVGVASRTQNWAGNNPSSVIATSVGDALQLHSIAAAGGDTTQVVVSDMGTGSADNLIFFSCTYATSEA